MHNTEFNQINEDFFNGHRKEIVTSSEKKSKLDKDDFEYTFGLYIKSKSSLYNTSNEIVAQAVPSMLNKLKKLIDSLDIISKWSEDFTLYASGMYNCLKFKTLYTNEETIENITFKTYKSSNKMQIWDSFTIEFTADLSLGKSINPFVNMWKVFAKHSEILSDILDIDCIYIYKNDEVNFGDSPTKETVFLIDVEHPLDYYYGNSEHWNEATNVRTIYRILTKLYGVGSIQKLRDVLQIDDKPYLIDKWTTGIVSDRRYMLESGNAFKNLDNALNIFYDNSRYSFNRISPITLTSNNITEDLPKEELKKHIKNLDDISLYMYSRERNDNMYVDLYVFINHTIIIDNVEYDVFLEYSTNYYKDFEKLYDILDSLGYSATKFKKYIKRWEKV